MRKKQQAKYGTKPDPQSDTEGIDAKVARSALRGSALVYQCLHWNEAQRSAHTANQSQQVPNDGPVAPGENGGRDCVQEHASRHASAPCPTHQAGDQRRCQRNTEVICARIQTDDASAETVVTKPQRRQRRAKPKAECPAQTGEADEGMRPTALMIALAGNIGSGLTLHTQRSSSKVRWIPHLRQQRESAIAIIGYEGMEG
jgi:hypothetical protein